MFIRAAFLTRRACRNNRAHRRRELFTALLRHAAADDGGLGAGRCRLKASSLTRWLGTGKSSGTHARALTPACFMPASKDLMCVLDQVHGVGRKVARVEKATVPIAESVERLAVQVQAQAAVSARPGLRARPGGNDENKPPMRFGLGPR